MDPSQPYPRTSWSFKFGESVFAGIAILSLLMTGLELLPQTLIQPYVQFLPYLLQGIIGLSILGSLVYVGIWHRRERAGTVPSGLRHAWLQGIIRYWLAYEISGYGLSKLFKTQFVTPPYKLDIPLGDLSGYSLTWYYFGYSYPMSVIIGLFQIGGCLLLLYRRTTLLGAMILLPVMTNIVLINLFYDIHIGAFFNSVVFTLALLFLLTLDWDKLKRAFWDVVDRLPPVILGRPWTKQVLRILPLVVAIGALGYHLQANPYDKVLWGSWQVQRLTRNGAVVGANAWVRDTAAWNRIHFAGPGGVSFCANPYRYKAIESWRGYYELDSVKNSLRLVMYSSDADPIPDTLQAMLSNRSYKAMRLRGVWYGDTLDMQLARIR